MKKYGKTAIVYGVILASCAMLIMGCSKDEAKDKTEETPVSQETEVKEEEVKEPVMVINEITSDTGVDEAETEEEPEEDDPDSSMTAEENNTDRPAEEAFYITEITDDIFDRIYGKSFKEDCTLPREDLRYLHVLHKDINGVEHEGEMIVNVHIADDVLEIMKELYENDYTIEKIRLVDEYGADDELSMEDNNTSSFNFRFVPRTKKISKHGRGLAVDINPLYNPYITKSDSGLRVEPVNAGDYADRDKDFDYKIEKGDLCYDLFISHGFEWGGEWKNSKDYQHFEIPTDRISEWYP